VNFGFTKLVKVVDKLNDMRTTTYDMRVVDVSKILLTGVLPRGRIESGVNGILFCLFSSIR